MNSDFLIPATPDRERRKKGEKKSLDHRGLQPNAPVQRRRNAVCCNRLLCDKYSSPQLG
jgi:hypothetical protein